MAASNFLIVAAPTLVNVVGAKSTSDLQLDAAKGAVGLAGKTVVFPVKIPAAPLNFRVG